ncbi:hypothetical protein RGU72_05155 [Undibacterium sp. 5I1]|uniref:hypothetical protein n=1 Tax=unclassified Undibacterium TaxID=2630295 RepID=UPI002AB5BE96|nr:MULTISPECIES: hypothetical protein [unclassified Undibacterium]MDY7537642.1 hypothetical protein [Undibacterium sp. 5I1]MEB0230187.1 hypothetical protein [Undibacterium sp. 10I3]MEB0256379.1 hypothetical protein [Undibacterium sp. 5I1]
MRSSQKPTLKHETMGKCDPHEVYEHPAFGMIGMGIVNGGDSTLFGSDIKHGQRITITIKKAEHKRNLSNDWYFGREELIEVEMSHSQFAEFITNPNRGDGIPCTIKHVNHTIVPSIEQVETKHEMLRREIERSAKERLAKAVEKCEQLGALIESGKLPKAELRQIHADLKRELAYLPGSVGFVVEQGQEALERATTAAKIDIEATINNHVNRLGLETAKALGIVGPNYTQSTDLTIIEEIQV